MAMITLANYTNKNPTDGQHLKAWMGGFLLYVQSCQHVLKPGKYNCSSLAELHAIFVVVQVLVRLMYRYCSPAYSQLG
jgi:hypothetical protein